MFAHWAWITGKGFEFAGRHEPYEERSSRTELWEPGAAIPPGDPTGLDVRERGFGKLVAEFQDSTREQLEEHLGIQVSCRLTGINRPHTIGG